MLFVGENKWFAVHQMVTNSAQVKVIAHRVRNFRMRFSIFSYSPSFPIKMHATDVKMQKIEPDPNFFWQTKVLEAVVRVLLCVSCVPASCVHIWFVSCPCFMSLWVKYVPAVFVSLCVNYPVYISPVFWVWFRLVYSLFPGVSVHVSPALM